MQKDSSKAKGVYNHVKSLFNSEDIKRSFKYFAPIAAVSGFISDVITPIAPVIDYLAIGLIIITLFLVLIWLFNKNHTSIQKYLVSSIVVTVVICFFSVIGKGTENGYFGDNFEEINSFQQSIFNIEKGVENIEKKVDDINTGITEIKTAVIDKVVNLEIKMADIERIISEGSIIDQPVSLEDFLVNSMISYNRGDYNYSEKMLEKVFESGYYKFDLAYKYYEVLLNNYNADVDRINIKLRENKFTNNNIMFKLAELVHNFDGIDFFIRLEDISIKDQVLKAYIQNIKSKSFYISVQNYPTVINDLMCYWTKQFVKNDETLGLKILKAKSLFFDYIKSYQEFLVSTSYSNDENAVYDFYNQQYDQEYEKSQDICKAAWDTLLK